MKAILDSLQRCNIQTVFFQIRSMCDAMYASSYEPWSRFVSSERGANPGYDPLAFVIEEAHLRGMELHAWLNPYRYSSSSTTYGTGSSDYSTVHSDWLLDYGSYAMILNPGLPEVKQRIKDIVAEVVSKYNVDGIVFDDYFYAYGGTSSTLDAAAQALYKPSTVSVGDWRRQNVNQMIKGVYDTIQALKPYVTFGVSPFGTWTTSQTVATARGLTLPSGVGTTGDMYSEIYCDPVAWLEQGSVDYISPQLYWTTDSSYPYGILANWWSGIANLFGKHFYSSQSLSSLTASSTKASSVILQGEEVPMNGISTLERSIISQKSTITRAESAVSAFTPDEIGLQIDYNRLYDLNGAPGSVFYSNNKILSTSGFIDYLRKNKFTNEALNPAIAWKPYSLQNLVTNLALSGKTLSWNSDADNVRYAVYAVPIQIASSGTTPHYGTSSYLQGISYSKQFTLNDSVSSATHQISVSVLDRFGNEFSVRELNKATVAAVDVEPTSPIQGNVSLLPSYFKWKAVAGAYAYVVEIATDEAFQNVVFSSETNENQALCRLQKNMGDGIYYWRVRALVPNATSLWSSSATFVSKTFAISSPTDGETGVSLTPQIVWDNIGESASYTVQVATSSSFGSADMVYSSVLQGVSRLSLPAGYLLPETTYYVRVLLSNEGAEAISSTVSFTTLSVDITVPVITNPVSGSTVGGTSLKINWQEQYSKGFRVELSTSSSFPSRGTTVKSVGAYIYTTTYEGLSAQTYYVRVKAVNSAGYTDPSDVVVVTLSGNSGIDQNSLSGLFAYITKVNSLDQLIVNANQTMDNVAVSIVSIQGHTLSTQYYGLTEGVNKIDLSGLNGLTTGVYLVVVKTPKGRLVLKYKH